MDSLPNLGARSRDRSGFHPDFGAQTRGFSRVHPDFGAWRRGFSRAPPDLGPRRRGLSCVHPEFAARKRGVALSLPCLGIHDPGRGRFQPHPATPDRDVSLSQLDPDSLESRLVRLQPRPGFVPGSFEGIQPGPGGITPPWSALGSVPVRAGGVVEVRTPVCVQRHSPGCSFPRAALQPGRTSAS